MIDWINFQEKKPDTLGKYVIKTISTSSHKTQHKLEAYWNGNSFNISNQIVTHWLNEHNMVS